MKASLLVAEGVRAGKELPIVRFPFLLGLAELPPPACQRNGQQATLLSAHSCRQALRP